MELKELKKEFISSIGGSPDADKMFDIVYNAGIKKGLESKSIEVGFKDSFKEFEEIKKMDLSPGTENFLIKQLFEGLIKKIYLTETKLITEPCSQEQ